MSEMSPEHEATELRGQRRWRGVYLGVMGIFVLYVVLLAALSRAFQ
jgi:hypothetical protein